MEIVSIEKRTFEAMVADNERVDGQSGRVPDAQHQPTYIADASGQWNFGIQPNQSQDVLPSRRCETYRFRCGGQEKGSKVQRKDYMN